MAHNHAAPNHGVPHHGVPNHICMLDGPEYPVPLGPSLHERLVEENQRLKALLGAHGISWAPSKPERTVKVSKVQKRVLRSHKGIPDETVDLPHLPVEIQLRIVAYAMKCSTPIIDPFFKHRPEHLTKDEKSERKSLPVQILATCKTYQEEGTRLLFSQNEFIFTQVAALQNFARVNLELRSTVKHVTLRIVGRYYDNLPHKRNLFDTQYHPAIPNFKIPIQGRPKGAKMDEGIHAYCWQQFADFMINFQIPHPSGSLSKLLPSLKRMRIDLVNFCDHLHYPGSNFSAVVRWHTGPLVDELIMTGVPEDDPETGPEVIFQRLVTNEGVFASGPPIFVSLTKSLKSLEPLGLAVRVVRTDEEMSGFKRRAKSGNEAAVDPEGGKPPASYYPPGRTIWKFTQDSLAHPTRKWIEFDRESGWPADDMDLLWSDMGEMFDFESMPYESDDEDMD